MRKLYAVILLFPLMVLLAGTMWLSSQCTTMARMHDKCKMAARTCGKSEPKGKPGCASCVDCPLCCLVTFKPVFRLEFTRQVTLIDYTVMSDNNLSDYSQQHWKPPNRSFLS